MFSIDNDDALNYGSIGYVIAHELTHALDDQGRKYDKQGNVRQWWTSADIDAFNRRAGKLVEQFNNYSIVDMHVNGNLTLGENIADLAGIQIAYQAFQRTQQYNNGVNIDGYTPQQRFFLAYARTWRVKTTDEYLRLQIEHDPHAPSIARVNGPLSNMLPFYRAFHVNEHNHMYRSIEQRVNIW
jgi:putative endopeptidase